MTACNENIARAATHTHSVSPLVPTALLVQVLVAHVDENVAVVRGLLAASTSPDERRSTLVPVTGNADTTPTPVPPAPRYRPCGSPPWGEP
jgi:hypothetical protein